MNKEIARGLLPLVNTFNDELFAYANARITFLHKQLETTMDFNGVIAIQGQIRELRRLISLRDEVIQTLKDK